jgi:hypothetical protein
VQVGVGDHDEEVTTIENFLHLLELRPGVKLISCADGLTEMYRTRELPTS